MPVEYRFSEEEVQARFDEIMDLVDNEKAHIIITRDGVDVAALIPYSDWEYYQSLIDGGWEEATPNEKD